MTIAPFERTFQSVFVREGPKIRLTDAGLEFPPDDTDIARLQPEEAVRLAKAVLERFDPPKAAIDREKFVRALYHEYELDDVTNLHGVARHGQEIVMLIAREGPMTQTQALVLAAWLVALADESDEHARFRHVLRQVENT